MIRRTINLLEWRTYATALIYVVRQLSVAQLDAISQVNFVARPTHPHLRGSFLGVQAQRDRAFVDALVTGARASGQITIYVRGRRVLELIETVHHEIDHALGFDEGDVLRRSGWHLSRITEARLEAAREASLLIDNGAAFRRGKPMRVVNREPVDWVVPPRKVAQAG